MELKKVMEKIFSNIPNFILSFYKEKGIYSSIEEKVKFYIDNLNKGDTSKESFNVFLEAIKKDLEVFSKEELSKFKSSVKEFKKNISLLKKIDKKIDNSLILEINKNLNIIELFLSDYKKSQKKIIENIKEIFKEKIDKEDK